MKITNLAVKYRTAVVTLTVILVIGGLYSYLTIPKEASPSIEIPYIVVTTVYPGVSPDDIESLITQPIEKETQVINGIKEIRSTSTEGISTVVIEFDPEVSIEDAYQKVREKVDVAQTELPTDVEDPVVSEIDITQFPIMTVNLAANYSLHRLKEVAEDLVDELEGISSVLEVDMVGGLEREVQVNIDLYALKGYNLDFNDIIDAIRFENTTIPGGSVDVDRMNYLVRVTGEFTDPDQLRDLVVKMPEQLPGEQTPTPIYLRDVAKVVFGFKERDSHSRLTILKDETVDGDLVVFARDDVEERQVISLGIKKRSGENILETVTAVREVLDSFVFPPGTQWVITGDQSKFLKQLLRDLENNIISGLFFVVGVLLFFLGVRTSVLVGIAIPLSMFLTFILLQALGYTLNFIILFSLIIALGMLVDNAVVIVENIYRYREEGFGRFEAAKLATGEVGGAVVASTATTVAAFVPMLFWPGIMGEFMGYMPLTLILALTCSLFVAMIINPVITGIFVRLDTETGQPHGTWAKRIGIAMVVVFALVVGLANPITLGVLVFGILFLWIGHHYVLKPIGDHFVREGLPRFVERYRSLLRWMLDRDYTVPHAMLRNTFSLGAFTLGFVLMLLGFLVRSGLGESSGQVLLVPAWIFLGVGLIGILFHTLEAIFRGATRSMLAGVVLTLLMALAVGLASLSGRPIGSSTVSALLALPIFVILVGGFGWLHRRFRFLKAVDRVLLGLGVLMVLGGIVFAAVLFILPQMGVQLLAPEAAAASTQSMAGLIQGGLLLSMLAVLGLLFFRGQEYLVLSDHRAILMTTALGALFAIVGVYAAAPTGTEFFPDTDPNQIMVNIDGDLGTNLDASNELAFEARARLEDLLDNELVESNVQNILVNVGVGGDILFGGGASGKENSQITLNVVDYSDRAESSTNTLDRIRNVLSGLPGATIEIEKDENGPPTGAPVSIEISGEDFETIVSISKEVKRRLREGVESGAIVGLVDLTDNLDTGRPEMRVTIDRERAARFGLNTSRIAGTIRTAISGTEASKFRDGEEDYDVTVRLAESDRDNLESLENLTIFHEGRQIPLVSVADFEIGSGLGSITRLDLDRVVTVEGENAPGYNANAVLTSVQTYLSEYEASLPPGYALTYTGESEEQDESFGFLTTALLVGVALIFMIMVAQFNRVTVPFIIMVAVGLSMIGVMLGLILTRTPFGLMTFIGVISLAGIVVNNNIVLIDYIIQLRDRGLSKIDAIVQGGATRLRPVLLTALTTILGLVPLTFGLNVDFVGLLASFEPGFQFGSENTQFWGPMGTAIISGLVFATFLTLVIVPVMYSTFDSLADKLRSQYKGTKRGQSVPVRTDLMGSDGREGDGAAGRSEIAREEEVVGPIDD